MAIASHLLHHNAALGKGGFLSFGIHDDIAVIDINVVLLEGANIPAVCRNIQVAVKEAVQSMTSINVSKVNVTVADIRFHGEKGANTAD